MDLQLSVIDMALLADAAYTRDGTGPEGYVLKDQVSLKAEGAHIQVWEAPNGQRVFAFRGTVPTDKLDIENDMYIAAGKISPATTAALDWVNRYQIDNPPAPDSLPPIFVGHSKGGYEAQYIATILQNEGKDAYAVTFDSPALRASADLPIIPGKEYNNLNIYAASDPVTNYTLRQGGILPGQNSAVAAGPDPLNTIVMCDSSIYSFRAQTPGAHSSAAICGYLLYKGHSLTTLIDWLRGQTSSNGQTPLTVQEFSNRPSTEIKTLVERLVGSDTGSLVDDTIRMYLREKGLSSDTDPRGNFDYQAYAQSWNELLAGKDLANAKVVTEGTTSKIVLANGDSYSVDEQYHKRSFETVTLDDGVTQTTLKDFDGTLTVKTTELGGSSKTEVRNASNEIIASSRSTVVDGSETSYWYSDRDGQVTMTRSADGSMIGVYTYPNTQSRLEVWHNADGSSDYTTFNSSGVKDTVKHFDDAGNLREEQRWTPTGDHAASLYDGQGRLTERQTWYYDGGRDINRYDASGQIVDKQIYNKDGSYVLTLYNLNGSDTVGWREVTTTYNTTGQTEQQQVTFNDGSKSITTWDSSNKDMWQATSRYYDNSGALINTRTLYDDRSYSVKTEDASNTETWASQLSTYDASGRVTYKSVIFDDKTSITSNIQWNGDAYTTDTVTYDSQRYSLTRTTETSTGERTITIWDRDNTQPWRERTEKYDASGHLISLDEISDNGDRHSVSPEGERHSHSENGKLVSESIIYPDGSRKQYSFDIATGISVTQAYDTSGRIVYEKSIKPMRPDFPDFAKEKIEKIWDYTNDIWSVDTYNPSGFLTHRSMGSFDGSMKYEANFPGGHAPTGNSVYEHYTGNLLDTRVETLSNGSKISHQTDLVNQYDWHTKSATYDQWGNLKNLEIRYDNGARTLTIPGGTLWSPNVIHYDPYKNTLSGFIDGKSINISMPSVDMNSWSLSQMSTTPFRGGAITLINGGVNMSGLGGTSIIGGGTWPSSGGSSSTGGGNPYYHPSGTVTIRDLDLLPWTSSGDDWKNSYPSGFVDVFDLPANWPHVDLPIVDRPPGDYGGIVVIKNRPVFLDLDGDGLEFKFFDGGSEGPSFDFDGDGHRERTAWVGSDDGILAIDLAADGSVGADGVIDHAKELAFANWSPDARTDLEGLRIAFDSNNDGILDAADARFSEFRIWRDANQNGVVDAGEIRTLSEAGIVSIKLTSNEAARVLSDGTVIHGITTFRKFDGTEGLAADVSLPSSRAIDGTIKGTIGNDHLFGYVGNTTVDGGTWADRMEGLAGDDNYVVDNSGDQIIETGEGGNDSIWSIISYALPDYVENLVLLGTADLNATGNNLKNVISGNDGDNKLLGKGGDDVILGGFGDDFLDGGEGNDRLDGGEGSDRYRFGSDSGNDIIYDGGLKGADCIDFASFNKDDVTFARTGNDLDVSKNLFKLGVF